MPEQWSATADEKRSLSYLNYEPGNVNAMMRFSTQRRVYRVHVREGHPPIGCVQSGGWIGRRIEMLAEALYFGIAVAVKDRDLLFRERSLFM